MKRGSDVVAEGTVNTKRVRVSISSASNGELDLSAYQLYQRVRAKYGEGDGLYFGTIVKKTHVKAADSWVYTILYDDGDERAKVPEQDMEPCTDAYPPPTLSLTTSSKITMDQLMKFKRSLRNHKLTLREGMVVPAPAGEEEAPKLSTASKSQVSILCTISDVKHLN